MTLPAELTTTATNSTPQQDVHPALHNDTNAAVNEITEHLTRSVAAIPLSTPFTGPAYAIRTGSTVTVTFRIDRGSNLTVNDSFQFALLPVGYRPNYGSVYCAAATRSTNAGDAASALAVQIDTSGVVTTLGRVENLRFIYLTVTFDAT